MTGILPPRLQGHVKGPMRDQEWIDLIRATSRVLEGNDVDPELARAAYLLRQAAIVRYEMQDRVGWTADGLPVTGRIR